MKKYFLLFIFFITIFPSAQSQTWTNLITGAGSGFSDYVLALAVDSSTNDLYVGGTFNIVSGQSYSNLVKWNGNNWINIGADGIVNSLAKLNGSMYAGGWFSAIAGVGANRAARFDGATWLPLGNGVNAPIYAFAWFGGMLYAGGSFSGVNGFSTSANHIATWNGSTWAPVGSGANNGTTASGCCLSGDVNALCVYNGDLYVGGEFSKAGGVGASCIAKWNGSSWSGVGGGINTYVTSLVVYNNELYAGGNFTTAGGVTAHNIARWNGTAWASVGSPTTLNNPIWAMEVIDGELYVAGSFSGVISSGTSKFVAKWNGSSWNNVSTGSGTDNVCYAIAGVPTGWVYVGGGFLSGDGNSNDVHIARLLVSSPLPVELISFDAIQNKNVIDLNWTTTSESNNDYFTLEKSSDGISFSELAKIKGAGSSNEISNYSIVDEYPLQGINYYRLSQTDFNGRKEELKIISVKNTACPEWCFSIYPNPVKELIVISYSPDSYRDGNEHKAGEITITEAQGKKVYKSLLTFKEGREVKVPLGDLEDGIYFIVIHSKDFIFKKKFLKE